MTDTEKEPSAYTSVLCATAEFTAIRITTLQIDHPEIEKAFWIEDRQLAMRQSAVALYTGLALYVIFGVLDTALFPSSVASLWLIRYAAVTPVMVVSILAYHIGLFPRYMHAFLFASFLSAGLGIVAMTAILPSDGEILYYVGLTLVSVFGSAFLRIPFPAVVVANVIIVASWEASCLSITPMEKPLILSCNFFYLSVVTLSLFNGYVYERERRRNFIQRLTIEHDRRKLSRLNDDLKVLTIKDALTGLFNRRHLLARTEELISTYRRHKTPASVIMIDLDGFKNINDTLGHGAGDAVLKGFAGIIRSVIRETDIAFRLGGDEFCILAPATKAEDAARIADRLLVSLQDISNIQEFGFETSHEITVGLSAGCTMIVAENAEAETLLDSADKLLYQAKRAGKGKVVWV